MQPMTAPAATAADERCACGNLVAKVTPRGVEILCRRCKRVHRIPWEKQREARGAGTLTADS